MEQDERRQRAGKFLSDERERMLGYVRGRLDGSDGFDAEDIVQEVALNFFNAADFTLPIERLAGYLYRSLKNRIVDYYRSRRNELSMDDFFSDGNDSFHDIIGDDRIDLHLDLERVEIRNCLYQSLAELSGDQRDVIVATLFEGKTLQEYSSLTGIPLGTLLSRRFRGLERLRSLLTNCVMEVTDVLDHQWNQNSSRS